MVSIARLSVVKQSSFGLPGQYGRRVTRANDTITGDLPSMTNLKGFKVANVNVNSLMKRTDEMRHLPVSLLIFWQ